MNTRTFHAVAVALTALATAGCATSTANSADTPGAATAATATTAAIARRATVPERAVRRDIPMTNMIRNAFAAGTRDSTGRPGRNYWQLKTEYDIDASFDPGTRRVTGSETIVVHNNSDKPLTDVVLRLDQNLFAANVPKAEQVSEITDGMQVTKLAYNGTTIDLTARQPRPARGSRTMPPRTFTTATGLDLTSAVLQLATPIAPHSSGTIQAEWNFRVPRSDNGRGVRMGSWGDSLFQVGQWYPRVAVYDDLRGWDTDPYLGPSEFYNNFGEYDVNITVPAGWLVASTGQLQNPNDVYTPATIEKLSHVLESDAQQNIVSATERGPGKSTARGDRLTWHFVADSVADVAWATSDRFVFDATRANIPGKGQIPIYIYYEPNHAQSYSRVGELTRHALEFYSDLWMPYAFDKMSVVDGPEGGMEYPNFIMSGAGAADHETGHQWWPMMVGVNETWYGWMDEGFNQYMNILSDVDADAPNNASSHVPMPNLTPAERAHQPRLNGAGQSYGSISGNEREAPLMWDANFGGPMYSFQAYGKAPLMLSMLGGVVGDSAVQRAMSEYAVAWRYKHPSPWDYAFFMNNALHRDLGWFWNYWLFTTESVDGSIQNVTTRGNATTVTVHQAGQMPSPVVLKVQFAPTGAAITPMANAKLIDDTTAIVTYPVDVWFSGDRTFDAVLDFGGRTIQSITFDPYGRFPDRNPADNTWPR
jgi:hypothetical protein